MVDKEKLLERLMATFLDELDEHVRCINEELMALEKNPHDVQGGERLTRLFRAAHSLKGASRAVDQPGIEQICHRMEDIFTAFREESLQPTPDICSLLFDVADGIESAGMQLREKSQVDAQALDDLLKRLKAARDIAGVSRTTSAEVPPEPPPEEDAAAGTASVVSEIDDLQPDVQLQVEEASPSESFPAPVLRAQPLPTTIRVAEEKLDTLLAQSGELLVARQRVDARPADLEPILASIASWRAEWRGIVGTLRQAIMQNTSDPLLRRSSRLRDRASRAVDDNGEHLARLEEQLEQLSRNMTADSRQLTLASAALQDDVHRIRMLPFAEACAGLERAVRDVCQSSGKNVELVIEGGDIEVDRGVLEGLSDPLLHLVRNAADHGIELPAQRRAAGKPESATITVAAAVHGAEVDVTVADDGQGLDYAKIRQRLRRHGLPEPPDERQLARCIFAAGFSTADVVTDVSGRGVGMDVVKSRIESLHGRVDIASEPGRGTRFTLSVPLTLTTVSALFVRCGTQTFAFPTSTVVRLVRFSRSALKQQQGRMVLPLGELPVRVASLAEVLELPPSETDSETRTAVLAGVGERQVLFVVDEVLSEREAVIKTLGRRILYVPHVSGAITLRTGRLALLLNTHNLIGSVEMSGSSGLPLLQNSSRPAETSKRRVLVVDDSMTTRTLLKSILESAGYDVLAANDGSQAWEVLQNEQVDIVVSDVDMPGMTGFELTKSIRQMPDRGHLPIILVTSRDADSDKRRGVEVGADAYLVKSSFDQSAILETVEQFL